MDHRATVKMVVQVGRVRFFHLVAAIFSLIYTTAVISGFAYIRVFCIR